jgi:putative membrane-bound dehydrogenase-like protein
MIRQSLAVGLLATLATSAAWAQDQPQSLDPRIKISLFAENPQIVTPTGIDVDEAGRVWAIESNTHFPPEGYAGHPTDRVLVFTDQNGDGKADEPSVFADGVRHAMSIAVRPAWMAPIVLEGASTPSPSPGGRGEPTQIFLATRRDLQLLEDTDNDGKADRRTVLLQLDTKGDYPHNGLAGLAFDSLDNVYIGFGENLGETYTLKGRDGVTLSGGAEGGNVYRFRPDGTKLELWSTGFWNPHASCVDALGHLFTVDNDPDSRPPCRLMHSVRGADFGYRFRNGRKGLHPFTAWNGEVPGTLPMLAGTGEAPSGLLAYESAGLPNEYVGDLLGGSWGDHRIDRFRLKQKGASYESVAEPIIVGNEEFRPVGLATAPDGSIYVTDWVKRDYKVHGFGRIWRISNVDAKQHQPLDLAPIRIEKDEKKLLAHIKSPKLAERRVAARRLSDLSIRPLIALAQKADASTREKYEGVSALIPHKGLDHERQLPQYATVQVAPFDAVQTLYLEAYDQVPSIPKLMGVLENPAGTDSQYILGSMRALSPMIRTLGSSQPKAAVTILNKAANVNDPFVYAELIGLLRVTLSNEQILKALASKATLEPRLRNALVIAAARPASGSTPSPSPGGRGEPESFVPIAVIGLADPDASVRRSTVQAIAELKLTALKPEVEKVLTAEPMTEELFLATLAALEMLDGKSPVEFDKTPAAKYVIPLLKTSLDKPAVAIQAIRLAQPKDSPEVAKQLAEVVTGKHPLAIQQEAIRTLATAMTAESVPVLQGIAADENANLSLRQWAIVGLASQPSVDTSWWLSRWKAGAGTPLAETILPLLEARSQEEPVQAVLATRSPVYQPGSKEEWTAAAAQANPDDQESVSRGLLVFSHPNGPGCIKCHRLEGRGGMIGPDLSRVGSTFTPEKLVESILEPSKEVSPQFTSWTMTTPAGVVHTGMLVFENEGKTILGNAEGNTIELKTADVETRTPQKTSVMPEKLVDRMSQQEWIDLIAFLRSRK